jgi:hypothetical protein
MSTTTTRRSEASETTDRSGRSELGFLPTSVEMRCVLVGRFGGRSRVRLIRRETSVPEKIEVPETEGQDEDELAEFDLTRSTSWIERANAQARLTRRYPGPNTLPL